MHDEDEIKGTGKGKGRKGKEDGKKAQKGKKNRYTVLTHLPCKLRKMLQLAPIGQQTHWATCSAGLQCGSKHGSHHPTRS